MAVRKSLIIKWIILVVVVFTMGYMFFYQFQDAYVLQVNDFRAQKDTYFKTGQDAPIDDQVGFKKLTYFNPDKKYKLSSKLIPIVDSSFITIQNNDGEKNKYLRKAYAVFELENRVDSLTLLLRINKKGLIATDSYFVPFSDLSNGESSYEGGRYLDIHYDSLATSIEIDFNYAYNPYCVYNYRYSCPIPPRENFLNYDIQAGEKKYVKNP